MAPIIGLAISLVLLVLQTASLRYIGLLWPVEVPVFEYPSELHQDTVNGLIERINETRITAQLRHLAGAFPHREFNSDTGESFAVEIESLLRDTGVSVDIHHHGWRQPSLIAKIPGTQHSKVVVGCHLDSVNLVPFLSSPGVDDDLSGIVTLLEAIRILQQKPPEIRQSLEFHFYAAEEPGLRGSLDILANYTDIVAFLQQDMTGFSAGAPPHFGVVEDYAAESLTKYVKRLIGTYCTIPYRSTRCGQICSDHSAALINGFPAVYVLESELAASNPYIHTEHDTLEHIDVGHVAQHVRLVLAFALETALMETVEPHGAQAVRFKWTDIVVLSATSDTLRFVMACIILSCAVANLVLVLRSGGHRNLFKLHEN
ncbi:hypothetical protein KL942_001485 [Ogataea angusta]|uniref:Peptide hydrolase n=1 Tax=Pichia angusta TaxID=870730 RepID=A0ABQ7S0D6_PICAN|nr:hypothetical protein KL942_001485 [Ogataea angusta]KAG7850817.1 hypothetical protein KL940_001394 [Ogataea angusta]KAG7859853.1 hypothetical protein KL919_002558 [Ogataea angusta]